MSDNNNNKDKDNNNKQERQQAIKSLVVQSDEQLAARENELFGEVQKYREDHLVKVSNLRTNIRALKVELDKFPGQQAEYDRLFKKYEQALKESQGQEEKITTEIQNIQAARMVKRDAVALTQQKEINDNAIKAAVEGQKPFKPQVTPDQDFEIIAATKGMSTQIAEEQAKLQKEQQEKEQQGQQSTKPNTNQTITGQGGNPRKENA